MLCAFDVFDILRRLSTRVAASVIIKPLSSVLPFDVFDVRKTHTKGWMIHFIYFIRAIIYCSRVTLQAERVPKRRRMSKTSKGEALSLSNFIHARMVTLGFHRMVCPSHLPAWSALLVAAGINRSPTCSLSNDGPYWSVCTSAAHLPRHAPYALAWTRSTRLTRCSRSMLAPRHPGTAPWQVIGRQLFPALSRGLTAFLAH